MYKVVVYSSVFALILASLLTGTISAQQPKGYTLIDDMYVPSANIKSASPLRTGRWINGVLPLNFDSNVTPAQRTAFFAACQWWSDIANITCQDRTNEKDFITVASSNVNNSFIGRIGGNQRMNIYNWNVAGIMAHEIGHALGLMHEHMRPERDQYVTIMSANIDPKYANNFAKINPADIFSYYDYESIMHYDRYAFSINNQPTIVPKDPIASASMGQRDFLSRRDELGAIKMYGPRGAGPLYQLPNLVEQKLFNASSMLRIDYGLNTTVSSGPTQGKNKMINICEAEITYPIVESQTPAAGQRVQYGSTITVTTKMGGEFKSFPPPKGRMCP